MRKKSIPTVRKRELAASKEKDATVVSGSVVSGGGSGILEGKEREQRHLMMMVGADVGIVILLSVLSFLTRFYKLELPAAVVFDEFHFYKFVSMYRKKLHLFDIHPPLGKLILLLGGYIGNFNPNFEPSSIGKAYPTKEHYLSLRQTSAFFGSLSVPLTYGIARQLGLSQIGSATAASMLLFDMLNTIESRLVLIDSQVLFFSQLALFCALLLWKQPPKSRRRWVMLVVTGVFAGCALSIKWTTLATPGIIAVVSFFGCFLPRSRLTFIECLTAGASGIVVYAISFWIHFKLSVNAGEGDPFMPMQFQSTLVNSRYFDKNAIRKPFFDLFVYLNQEMLRANAAIKTRHPWESKWFEWPLDLRGILYYTSSVDGQDAKVYLVGNPVVFYICLLGTASFMGIILYHLNDIRMETARPKVKNILDSKRMILPYSWFGPGILLLTTYWLNLIPYVLVERAAFIYHFIPGLFYAILLTALLIDRLPMKYRIPTCTIIILSSMAAFWFWAPWIYATPLLASDQMKRELFPRWN